LVPPKRRQGWQQTGGSPCDAAGFVITDTANDLRNGLRTEPNVVKGYFMVRPAKTWVKVEAGPGSGAYQTQLTR
jgi:hypothetical protein